MPNEDPALCSGSPFDVNHSLQTNIINTAIDDAVNAAITDERISAETLALQALGIATGDVMQRTPMMQTLTRYEREMEKQSFERQANQANAETRANRTQLTASTRSKATRNRNSTIDDYLTASTHTLLGQPIPNIELTERNLPSFDDPRWTHVSGNKDTTRLSRWQSTKTSNAGNKWVAFGKQFASGFIRVNAPLLLEMEAIGEAFTGQIGKVITDIKAVNRISQPGISDIYHDMLNNDYGVKGYGLGTATGWLAGIFVPGIGVAKGLGEFGVFGTEVESLLNTGARQIGSIGQHDRFEHEAAQFYEAVRNLKSNYDVSKISKNTGIPEYRIQRIKDHLFNNKHILSDGNISNFDPDIEVADSWRRLQTNTFHQQDINLLHHEYFEARFEGIFKTDYITAHNASWDAGKIWDPYEFITEPNSFTWRKP